MLFPRCQPLAGMVSIFSYYTAWCQYLPWPHLTEYYVINTLAPGLRARGNVTHLHTSDHQHVHHFINKCLKNTWMSNIAHGACEMWPKGSDVSQRFCQGKKLVHICMESEQLKTKSNPGKFWRKCSFSDFLAKMGGFWG